MIWIILTGNLGALVPQEFSERALSYTREFKRLGKTVYCNFFCESILDFPFDFDILRLCDRVICCSEILAEQVRIVNSNTAVMSVLIRVG